MKRWMKIILITGGILCALGIAVSGATAAVGGARLSHRMLRPLIEFEWDDGEYDGCGPHHRGRDWEFDFDLDGEYGGWEL